MDLQDVPLAGLLFGGHVLSGVWGVALLHPYFGFLPRRILLSLALLMTPAGLGYLALFDLELSGRYLPAALPLLLSAVFLAAFMVSGRRARAATPRRAVLVTALLVPAAWAHFFTLALVHRCFLGACA